MATPIDRVPGEALSAWLDALLRSVKTIGGRDRTFHALARLFAVGFGLSALIWGAATFPMFWAQLSIERTADAIVDGEVFKPHSLEPLLPAIDQIERSNYCWPEALHNTAVIRLQLAEEAITNADRDAIDLRLGILQDAIHRSLACSPSDPFLWMILAWLDQMRQGFRPEQLTYLRLSYHLGPYEGWIAERRSRLALSVFERLPPDLAEDVVREFDGMVQSYLYRDAISIITGPGWPIHDRLLASLRDVDVHQREELAKELYAAGYNVVVPGIAPIIPRPWY
jgi:hypothetical protein